MKYTVSSAWFFIVNVMHSVSGQHFVKCYNVTEYEHCLSTVKVTRTWRDAKTYCERNNSRLLSITNNDIASISLDFRISTHIDNGGTWIDVSTATVDNFHWINGLTGNPSVENQDGGPVARRFAVITIINNNQTVYYAQTFDTLSFYICQYSDDVCGSSDFTRNLKCYRKYNSEQVTWFTASNKCLSQNGSLATFNDLLTPNNDNDLKLWLNITTTSTTRYWIGLVRRWFVTTAPDGTSVDVQYTNWQSGSPSAMYSINVDDSNRKCVLVAPYGSEWIDSVSCNTPLSFVCQAIRPTRTTATTAAVTSASELHHMASTTSSSLMTTLNFTCNISQNTDEPISSECDSNSALAVRLAVGLCEPVVFVVILVVVYYIR